MFEKQTCKFFIFKHTGFYRGSQACLSTMPFDEYKEKNEIEDDNFIDDKKELEPQGVDPIKGWGFRGVHKVSSSILNLPIYTTSAMCCWSILFSLIVYMFTCMFHHVGDYLRKNWSGSCTENIKEWQDCDHIHCWNWRYVRPKNYWS